jgi:hypothetical protein
MPGVALEHTTEAMARTNAVYILGHLPKLKISTYQSTG